MIVRVELSIMSDYIICLYTEKISDEDVCYNVMFCTLVDV